MRMNNTSENFSAKLEETFDSADEPDEQQIGNQNRVNLIRIDEHTSTMQQSKFPLHPSNKNRMKKKSPKYYKNQR